MRTYGSIPREVEFFGRTLYDEQAQAVFFNWSGSGFEAIFEATKIEATLVALPSAYPPEGELWPCVSVYIDDMETPVKELLLDQPTSRHTLFESNKPERHRIRVVKRTENDKGKAGVSDISVAGILLPNETSRKRLRLEFIGDSISCGFGNEASAREGLFVPQEQNEAKTYCAVAAKLLDAEYHNISISGISLCAPLDPDFALEIPGFEGLRIKVKAMEDYYAYTDRVLEEYRGKSSEFSNWEFRRFQPDAIVINLGTNDSYRIKASGNPIAEMEHYERRYAAFLKNIRRLNGPTPVVCCTLGPMDYYLYDNILEAVRKYKSETGDARVFCYKFGGIYPVQEGYGSSDHPSTKTHLRMGKELSAQLTPWLQET